MIKDAKESETPQQLDILVGDQAIRIKRQDGTMIIAQPGEIVKNVAAFDAQRIVVARRGRAAREFRQVEPAPEKRGRGRPKKEEAATSETS